MNLKPFTILAHRRWSEEEVQTLRDMFIAGRENNIPHKQLWDDIATQLDRNPSEVQRKLVRMYKSDDELQGHKRNSWSREKILEQLKQLYTEGHEMNKSALPQQLCFIILKVCPPSAPKHRCWFQSLDHALAEAILSVGCQRTESGELDSRSPITTLEQALEYVHFGHKKRHAWTLDEIKTVLNLLHDADFPLTLAFLSNHYDLYKNVLSVNRKLESFKDVIKKFVEDGSIKSYPDLVCTIAPEYIAYYNEDKSRLRLSTEEIRVKKFLDRFKIPYAQPKLGNKIHTNLEDYPNVVPDFIILDENSKVVGIVEVFGSIGDRENAGVSQIYNEKTQAKKQFYSKLPNIEFIEIHNNNGRCDLDDAKLFELLGKFIKHKSQPKVDLEEIITTDAAACNRIMARYGVVIYYDQHKYHLHSAALDFQFDKLFDLPKLTSKNPAMKKLLEFTQKSENPKLSNEPSKQIGDAADASKTYAPYNKDIYYDSNRQIGSDIDHPSISDSN